MISTVYGLHIPIEKENFIQNIRTINQVHNENLWLIVGDFNLITTLEEKRRRDYKGGTINGTI